MPSESEFREWYGGGLADWDTIAEYEERRQPFFDWVLFRLENVVPARGRLLDIGCGIGTLLRLAQERGWISTGVDVSDADAKIARARGLDIATTSVGGTLPVEASSVDVVTALDVFEHLSDPQLMAEEVARVLRPGGVAFVQTANAGPLFGRLLGRRNPALEHTSHICLFSKRSMRTVLRRAGLDLVTVEDESVHPMSVTPGRRKIGVVQVVRRTLRGAPDLYVIAKKGRDLVKPEQ